MKKLLLLALIPISVYADSVYMNNDAGGKVVLNDGNCTLNGKSYKELRSAYAYGKTGEMVDGCWTVLDGVIHVVYATGDRRVYEFTDFHSGK
jgi:hypothetical protein